MISRDISKSLMNIADKKREYLDKEIYNLVSLIETSDFTPVKTFEYVSEEDGSVMDLAAGFSGEFTSFEKSNSEIISQKRCEGTKCRELKNANYNKFIKFVDTIYKINDVNTKVSKDFILKLSFDYIIETHKNQKASCNFYNYLTDKIEESVANYKVYFSIHNLEIFPPIQIGKVMISLVERNILVEDQIRQDSKSVELFFSKYGSRLFVSLTVKAEKEKAMELAFNECCLAIDVLKICCDTLDDPLSKISFDIDSRITETTSSETLIRNTEKVNDLTFKEFRIPKFHQVDASYRKRLIARNLNFFSSFLIALPEEKSELQKLLLNSIRRFAKALTYISLNQRVVELFTIMESLVVPNSQSNILQSLTIYSSKLVHKTREDRIELILVIKRMYEIRSAYVHHAKENEFEIEDLRRLQFTVQALIGKLVEKSASHSSKISVLQEIDDAILDAY